MNKDIINAMEILYKLESGTSSSREKEIIEWALNEIVKNPNPSVSLDCENRASVIACYALKTARSKFKRRSKYHQDSFESDIYDNSEFKNQISGSEEFEHKVIELKDFIDKSSLNDNFKQIIGHLMNDLSISEIAKIKGVSENTVNVWISRARKKAKIEWRHNYDGKSA